MIEFKKKPTKKEGYKGADTEAEDTSMAMDESPTPRRQQPPPHSPGSGPGSYRPPPPTGPRPVPQRLVSGDIESVPEEYRKKLEEIGLDNTGYDMVIHTDGEFEAQRFWEPVDRREWDDLELEPGTRVKVVLTNSGLPGDEHLGELKGEYVSFARSYWGE